MSADLAPAAARPAAIPFDLAATLADPGWRDRLVWPLPPHVMRRVVAAPSERLFDYLRTRPPAERDVLLLAMPRYLGPARFGLEVALTLQTAGRAGIEMATDEPTVRYFLGDRSVAPGFARGTGAKVVLPRHPSLRRLARTASWTPGWRLPRTLLAPSAQAITHNGLLVAEARRCGAAVAFHQAEAYLTAGRETGATAASIPAAGPLIDLLCDEPALAESYRPDLKRLVARAVEPALAEAADDLAGLARLRRLPLAVWSGTGGQWASRAVGLSVLARGGSVRRFDHGGTSVMAADPLHLALVEAAVSSVYVLPTAAAAERVGSGAFAATPRLADCTLEGGGGDPHFRAVPRQGERRAAARPRILYAPTILRGARQFHHGLLPDPVYLDWQLRVAEALRDAPVDLLCKPHPEGLLRGQAHPLAAVAPTSTRRFEAEMDEADVFLLDHPESTTFWTALCSDKPVFLLDLGTWQAAPEVAAALSARATVIHVAFDANNLPVVPADLADMLRHAAGRRHDPGPFRALLAGD